VPTITYTAQGFPPSAGRKLQGSRTERFTWAELVHAAITVGRKNWTDVLQHGNYSLLEILWRTAMLRGNLRGTSGRIARSSAYRGLDRSEKGAVSFFLGLCAAKLFAERLLDVPWLLHLDVYRALVNPTFTTSKRPDFVGMDAVGHWIVAEAKGRTGKAPPGLLDKAKSQTGALSTVSGQLPVLRVAIATFFSSGFLEVQLCDPVDSEKTAVPLLIDPEELARAYYAQLFDFARLATRDAPTPQAMVRAYVSGVPMPGFDARVHFSEELSSWYILGEPTWEAVVRSSRVKNPALASYVELARLPEEERERRLAELEPRGAPKAIAELETKTAESLEFTGGDQVTVVLGDSWTAEVMALEAPERAG
jgi:hypothetical protein